MTPDQIDRRVSEARRERLRRRRAIMECICPDCGGELTTESSDYNPFIDYYCGSEQCLDEVTQGILWWKKKVKVPSLKGVL